MKSIRRALFHLVAPRLEGRLLRMTLDDFTPPAVEPVKTLHNPLVDWSAEFGERLPPALRADAVDEEHADVKFGCLRRFAAARAQRIAIHAPSCGRTI